MKRSMFALALASTLAAGTAWAQPYTPNERGVTMGHWHLNSANVEANKKIFGAKPGLRNEAPVADLPGTQLRFAKSATPTVTTKGRVLDHIGFDVKDLQGFIKTLEANGIKLDRPYTKTDNGGALAFITDPWGTYIELNERPNPVYLP